MYEPVHDFGGQPTEAVRRLSDGAIIPPDPQNADWQAYQEHLAAQAERDAAAAAPKKRRAGAAA